MSIPSTKQFWSTDHRFARWLPALAEKPGMPLRRALNCVLYAWGFGAAYFALTMGTAQIAFAKVLGVSEFGFGLLAAMPFVGAIAQVPACYMLERSGGHKRVFMSLGIFHRALWLFIALVPWVVPTGYRAEVFIALVGLCWLAGQASAPAWQSWAGDLVPERLRGRYFAKRNQLGNLVMLLVAVPVGLLLDASEGWGGTMLATVLTLLFVFAAVAGIVDLLFHSPVPADQGHRPQPQVRWRDMLLEPLRDYGYRRFLAYHATITFAVAMVGGYGVLYVLDVVMAGRPDRFAMATLITGVWPAVVGINSLGYWGKLHDRLGVKRTLVVSTLVAMPGPISWVIVGPSSWWLAFGTVAVAAFGWTGVMLAIQNMIMQMGRSRDSEASRNRPDASPRIRRRLGAAFIAVNALAVGIAGCAGGLFGGTVAEALTVGGPHAAWSAEVFGLNITWHLAIMSGATLLLGASLGWLVGMTEPRAINGEGAVKIVVVRFAEHLTATAMMPVRTLAWLKQASVAPRSPIARLGRAAVTTQRAHRVHRKRRRRAA